MLRIGQAVDIDPQQPLLSDLPLDIENFEALGMGHPLRRLSNPFEVHSLLTAAVIPWPEVTASQLHSANKKVGSRPLVRATYLEANLV